MHKNRKKGYLRFSKHFNRVFTPEQMLGARIGTREVIDYVDRGVSGKSLIVECVCGEIQEIDFGTAVHGRAPRSCSACGTSHVKAREKYNFKNDDFLRVVKTHGTC